jgi:phenylacetate-CoA ligase
VEFLDDAFDQAFEVKRRPTLAINCLPMGVGFSSRVMTLATTSVREDMVVGLVQAFGSYYDQLLLVTDPLFLKRLTDHAAQVGLDWHRYRVNVCIAEEIFGEHFRTHVSGCLGTDVWRPDRGRILSSFGVGELGLYLGYETQTTIALRRAAHANPELARDLFAAQTSVGQPLPMLFAFDPQRTFLEIVDPDTMGYGRMTISMLEPDRSVPLLRYQAGDIAALLDAERVAELAVRHGLELPGPVPAQLFALRGRVAEALPNGAHVGVYKDALYATPRVATSVTGAVRVIADGERCTMHVQLGPSVHPTRDLEAQLRDCLPQPSRRDHIVLWPYARFPFGMTLDYERKFAYYVPGELPSTIPD